MKDPSQSGAENYTGGVVGSNVRGTISSCQNTGSVTVSVADAGFRAYAGGVAGINNGGTVSGCTNTGTVTATGSNAVAGGVIGVNLNTVNSCYNTGTVTGTTAGGVVGENSNGSTSGTVNGCYFLKVDGLSGVGDNTSTNVTNVASKTVEEFASGEVAWLLQDALGPSASQVWGQDIGTDKYPVLTSDPDKKVYQVTFMNGGSTFATDYANSGDNVAFPKPDPTSENKEFIRWVDERTDYTDPITVNGRDLIVDAWFVEKAPAEGGGYFINFTTETATAAEDYQISTDGTEFRDGPLTITPGDTLYVRYTGNTEKFTTNTIPARLAAPTLTISNEAEGAEISGAYYYSFTSAEYGNTDWKQGTGALVTVEPDDTIYIYKAATDEAFKSNVQTLTAPSRGAAPTLPTIDYGISRGC